MKKIIMTMNYYSHEKYNFLCIALQSLSSTGDNHHEKLSNVKLWGISMKIKLA